MPSPGQAGGRFDPREPLTRPPPRRVGLRGLSVDAQVLLAAPQLDATLRSLLERAVVGPARALIVDFHSLGPAGDPRAAQLAALVAELRARGLRVHGRFALGRDHDDLGCFERLVAWVEAVGLAEVELRLWTPTPGSAEARALAREDRLVHRDLDHWDGAHVVVVPAQMSAQTLYRGWVWSQLRLGSWRSRWRRRPARLAALPGYLLAGLRAVDRLRFDARGVAPSA
ncbi:hypothetical protein G6O69_20550 [Pseudenhygromyxa sp. WMMC2535]|uniref:hypothetical protein n=1 Tax=Pseudenhygromyxa sp. WMMC2535 TaxID=2712867 RepID=UPI001554EC59|nr:hypothetical protein [Pseudenhygromyxa sp. WMMC2535]NVB40245.1 hypothetical protein [Pseudenhygromyxa sp. WMMC2535]